MDGTNSTVLHNNSRVTWPNGLTLDYTTQNLYWFDASEKYLGTSRSNGTNFRVIQTFNKSESLNPFDITFFLGVLYSTNWVDNSIRSLTLSAPSPAENRELLRVAKDPNGVKVFTSSRQPSLGMNSTCSALYKFIAHDKNRMCMVVYIVCLMFTSALSPEVSIIQTAWLRFWARIIMQ